MKKLFWIIVLLTCLPYGIFAQCENSSTIAATGKILKELIVKKAKSNSAEAELGLRVKASVKGASWQIKGAEAAVITVFVDGKYNQDVILFDGEESFEYQMLLGKYNFDEHRITIVHNKARSAPNVGTVKIHAAVSTVIDNSKASDSSIFRYFATINAPIIFARPDTIDKFSDIPLLTYYEIFDEPENVKKIRYTTIFTNEDGGTQSAALMARWGRMTDIEWVYEIRVNAVGEILSEIIQGANHETKNFTGQRFGSHPLIFDTTVNNNFADSGCSVLRVSPQLVEANLSNGSRETVMDKFPWTYQIMAREAIREGRVNPEKLGANTIADPRDYLYAEIYSELTNAAIALETEMPDGKMISSDAGNKLLRVNRPGFVRIALRLPKEFSKSTPTKFAIRCDAVSTDNAGFCENINLLKVVRLDRNYLPHEVKIKANPQTVKSSEKAFFPFAAVSRKK
jgi:hypothetical protein